MQFRTLSLSLSLSRCKKLNFKLWKFVATLIEQNHASISIEEGEHKKSVSLGETFIIVIEFWHYCFRKGFTSKALHAKKNTQIWKLPLELFSNVVKTNELILTLFYGMYLTILVLKRPKEKTNPSNKELIFNKDERCLWANVKND